MNYSKENILARLQKGETIDAIADEMADALNEAQVEHERLEEAKSKETKELADRREDMAHILFTLGEYLGKYVDGSEDLVASIAELDYDEIDEICDSIKDTTEVFIKLKNLEFHKPRTKSKGIFGDDPIAKFLGVI